jgi:hypothetical protein
MAIGDKNPGYAIYTERLLKIFPEAKFIHIIRDYRDNFVSIRDVDFELPVISVTVSKWKHFVKRFRRAAARHPGNHLEIRYEDLVSQPEEKFRELCEFVGIPFSRSAFDFYKQSGEAMRAYPKQLVMKYHTSLLNKVNTGRMGLWKKKLSEREVRVADACAGKVAGMAGYEKQYSNPGFKARLISIPGRSFAASLALATVIVDKMPYKLRRTILNRAPFVIGRLYLGLFNRKKLREIDEKIRAVEDHADHDKAEEGWKMAIKNTEDIPT